MGKPGPDFDRFAATPVPKRDGPLMVEIFVAKGFNGFELGAITQTLATANAVLGAQSFDWRFSSDMPGLVSGDQGMMVRAEPAVGDHRLADLMIVVGGKGASAAAWLPRARAMQRHARCAALLSEAATAYIRAVNTPAGRVTTHWRDAATLAETGYHPTLTTRLSENAGGILTSAGAGSTAEFVIGLISGHLDGAQLAELGNHLLLQTIRKSTAEQPKDIADNEGLFGRRVTEAIKLMEDTVAAPLSMAELTRRVGLSTRHLEREFRAVFDETPARFYKRLRARRARALIEETLLPMVDIAVATGFGSCDTLAKAVKDEYGLTPAKMRARRKVTLLTSGPACQSAR